MKAKYRKILKLKGRPINCTKDLSKETLEKLKNLEKSEIFQLMRAVAGLHPFKKGDEK